MTDVLSALNEDVRNDLLERAEDRGYVLASELASLTDLPVDDLGEALSELDVVVVDDVTRDEKSDETFVTPVVVDPVRAYLNRAGQHELLDRESEADLAKRYQAGKAAEDLLRSDDSLPAKQRAVLNRIARDGRRAQDRMVTANLRLVVPTAKRYAGNDMPLIEAIQEGNFGLLRAVEKFDHTKGYKFSTYAVWWIRQAIQRGLASGGRTIRIPTTVWEDAGKIRRAEADLRTSLGRDPDIEEVAETAGLREQRVRDVKQALKPLTSLDMPVGEDGDLNLGGLLPDEAAVDPEQDTARQDLRTRLLSLLDQLPERQRIIVELRYGLTGEDPKTLDDIGQVVGLTRERVRQLEREALSHLRAPAVEQGLEDAAGDLAA